jgi:general secretion pathway protein C
MDLDVDDLRGDSEVTPVWRDGRIEGLQLNNIEQNEYARELGLEEGDVVVSVNGIKIRSIDEAFTVANRLQRAPTVRVEVLREGKSRTLTYNVQ